MTKTRFPGLLGDSLFDKHPTLSRTMTLPAGAPDSVAIAEAARECAEQGSILVVIAANASDVIRLEQEVAWVDPLALRPDVPRLGNAPLRPPLPA